MDMPNDDDVDINITTCLLCLKECVKGETQYIYEVIKLCTNTAIEVSPNSVIFKNASPQTCMDCCNLLFKLSKIIKRNNDSKEILLAIINNIDYHLKPSSKQIEVAKTSNPNVSDQSLITKDDMSQGLIINDTKKCGMKHKKSSQLKKPKSISHSVDDQNEAFNVCDKNTDTISNYHKRAISKTHYHNPVKKKTRKYTYKCNYCDYVTLKTNTLEGHLNKIHLNSRPYECFVCNTKFYTKSNLSEHLATHSKKEHTCHECGDSFSKKRSLDDHLMLHSGTKPHLCVDCGNRFVNVSRLNEHVKMKHRDKCQTCDSCGKQFGLKRSLNRHMKQVHST